MRGSDVRGLAITATPFRSSRLAIPITPFSPQFPITPASPPLSPSLKSLTDRIPTPVLDASRANLLPQIPPPSKPYTWVWQCHQCHTKYGLGITRRCLEDGHHFCSGSTVVRTRDDEGRATTRTKVHRACPSEFDYRGWKAWGDWRRGEDDLRRLVAEELLLEGNKKKGNVNNDNVQQKHGGAWHSVSSRLFRTMKSSPPQKQQETRKKSVGNEQNSQDKIKKKSGCWGNCDFPSECRWGPRLQQSKMQEQEDKMMQFEHQQQQRESASNKSGSASKTEALHDWPLHGVTDDGTPLFLTQLSDIAEELEDDEQDDLLDALLEEVTPPLASAATMTMTLPYEAVNLVPTPLAPYVICATTAKPLTPPTTPPEEGVGSVCHPADAASTVEDEDEVFWKATLASAARTQRSGRRRDSGQADQNLDGARSSSSAGLGVDYFGRKAVVSTSSSVHSSYSRSTSLLYDEVDSGKAAAGRDGSRRLAGDNNDDEGDIELPDVLIFEAAMPVTHKRHGMISPPSSPEELC